MPALRMLEDAVKSAVTLRRVAAAWGVFCTSPSGEGGGGGRRRVETGLQSQNRFLGCVQLSAHTNWCLHMQASSCALSLLLCRSKGRRVPV